jgi:CheY-like chemotaxis protein
MQASHARSESVDILIADDDGALREALRLILDAEGYRCVEAADGEEAVDLARQSPPRLVLLDLMMPGLDGIAVARRLRADPRTRSAHIQCLTACKESNLGSAARRAGAEAVLTKPFDIGDLLDVVEAALNS